MIIETLDELNQVLESCACCTIPTTGSPRVEIERKYVAINPCGYYIKEDDVAAYYLNWVDYYEQDHSDLGRGDGNWSTTRTVTRSESFNTSSGNCDESVNTVETGTELYCSIPRVSIPNGLPPTTVIDLDNGNVGDNTIVRGSQASWDLNPPEGQHVYTTISTDTYSNRIVNTATYLFSNAQSFAENSTATAGTYAIYSAPELASAVYERDEFVNDANVIFYKESSYRILLPYNYDRNYYKVTWDILKETTLTPISGSPTTSQTFAATDLTWQWGEDDDTNSEWFEISPENGDNSPPITTNSEVEYTYRIVNVRYEGYRSTKIGQAPQTIGESVEL